MPVPWEALIPFGECRSRRSRRSKLTDPHFALCAGLLTACFGATGTLFNIAKRTTNDGKVGIGAPFLAGAPR